MQIINENKVYIFIIFIAIGVLPLVQSTLVSTYRDYLTCFLVFLSKTGYFSYTILENVVAFYIKNSSEHLLNITLNLICILFLHKQQ